MTDAASRYAAPASTSFVAGSTTRMVIYAGFAIVIVALIWVYISWLILLLGAQLAFYIQHPQYLRPGRGEIQLNASLRERAALSIVYLIVHDYCTTQHRWSTNTLAEHLGLPSAAIGGILAALERKGLLRWNAVRGGNNRDELPQRRFRVTAAGLRELKASRKTLLALWEGLEWTLEEN